MGVYRRADSKYWWIWIDGSKPPIRFCTKIPIGSKHGRRESFAEAETIYRASMGDYACGTFRIPTAKPPRTFRAHAEWYQQTVSAQHRSRVRERSMIGSLIAYFQDIPLSALTADKIEAWKTTRATAVAPSTVNRELEVLKPLLRSAVPTYITANPADKVRKFRLRKVPITILSTEAEDRLLKVASPAERAFLLLGLDALLRCGDARRLKVDHDHGSYLVLVDSKVDTYKVPVSTRLRAALDALKPVDGFYFPRKYAGRWAAMNANTAYLLFRALCDRAKVPTGRPDGITYHGLRHTGATRAASVVKLSVVRDLGGWKSLRQLDRYDHPDDPEMLRAVEAIGSRHTHAAVRKDKKKAGKRRAS